MKTFCAVFLITLSSYVFGQTEHKVDPKTCDAELKKYCASSKDGKQVVECVHKNFANFSKGCGNSLIEKQSANKAPTKEKCAEELREFCSDNSFDCYQKNRAKISPGCRSDLDNVLTLNNGDLLQNCMGDIDKHCPFPANFESDPLGQAKYNECVFKNAKNFSDRCMNSLGLDRSQFQDQDKTKVIKKEKR